VVEAEFLEGLGANSEKCQKYLFYRRASCLLASHPQEDRIRTAERRPREKTHSEEWCRSKYPIPGSRFSRAGCLIWQKPLVLFNMANIDNALRAIHFSPPLGGLFNVRKANSKISRSNIRQFFNPFRCRIAAFRVR
jgi:hypothetical protein